ncbi:glutamine amidotransferase [Methylobacterium sp. Leaf99]|uniref:glutamine amidotransferase-related protein n=1 Tax=unclassified Methylobacterium TaxID=2615210 RepID=UPI0006F2A62E|nr:MULTISPECIES: glutamine amidotransferase [unclassified Methylobacterium]KQP09968.1 glutamine amidotransferase [Methylobacterium sp. Leaf99]TXM73604.1 type 1 glutamine amidotransferase [Methylobacterium sp. WL69]
MKIGILETGNPPERLGGRYPTYGRMVVNLVGPGHAYTTYAVADGILPVDPTAEDAYLVTGSPAGVYEPLAWIAALLDFLRAVPPETPLVGLCFGHQVMAAAFGGRVAKSEKGWGLGLQTYTVRTRAPWMDDVTEIAVPAIHQDQVLDPPPGARTLAGNAFTPHGILGYSDRRALSFQVHPEFEADYATALIAGHCPAVPHEPGAHAAALASLGRANDGPRLGGWIRRFLENGD